MESNHWQKFLQGNEQAFSELYCFYFNELLVYGLKIGFDEEVCKDAIQDVFYKIYTSHEKLAHIRNIEFYLLHCLKNRLFDIHNVKTKINPIDYMDSILESENNVVEKIIEKETELQLENKIKQSLKILPPKQRKIIYYYYHLNLNYTDIATLLDMTPEAIKKSLYRALKKIKETSSGILTRISFYLTTALS